MNNIKMDPLTKFEVIDLAYRYANKFAEDILVRLAGEEQASLPSKRVNYTKDKVCGAVFISKSNNSIPMSACGELNGFEKLGYICDMADLGEYFELHGEKANEDLLRRLTCDKGCEWVLVIETILVSGEFKRLVVPRWTVVDVKQRKYEDSAHINYLVYGNPILDENNHSAFIYITR